MSYIKKYRGEVIEGKRLGRVLNYPTINLQPPTPLELKKGVYYVTIDIDNTTYHGAANYGIKPTVGDFAPLIEAHIFDFNIMIYGKEVEITFRKFIREELKFESVDQLKEQIKKDIEDIKRHCI